MKSPEIRKSFLGWFEDLGHRVVPSSSLVPTGDPTLFFANAGMNQFKDVFTGQAQAEHPRAASAQKCLRVSGKHNDFETVGRSLRHHTFFEMLGNFSFGDYFKREAITWAWQLVTERWRIDASQLVVTVHESDDEAAGIWRRDIGLGDDRIHRLGDADNYWSMGDTGPNGPCSEMYVDRGGGCGTPSCGPACSCGRYLEFWNLVFMQFERNAAGRVTRLPRPSIDTGMGLERIAAILQGRRSNYDTDLFAPILAELGARAGVAPVPVEAGRERESEADETQVSLRVVADHLRAITFLVADGVFPSNEGRGYVLRKLLRRAAGHAGRLGLAAPVLSELTAVVVATFGEAYPGLHAQAATVRATCEREERAFAATLQQGSHQFDGLARRLGQQGATQVPGDEAFRLHDTYGFPIEFTVEEARRSGLTVDRAGFDLALNEQKERARAAARTAAIAPQLPSSAQVAATEFRGYDELVTQGACVLALVRGGEVVPDLGTGDEGWLVLDRTPFYAESGGQVGDTGTLSAGPCAELSVLDCQTLRPGVTGHLIRLESGRVEAGDTLDAAVDPARRRKIMANHTATHLLHRALKDVLGEHCRQAGSHVAPERLRFDFTHPSALTPDELARVEGAVNREVFAHRDVTKRVMSHAEAIAGGAVAMFGEKYGDVVRVVAVGDWSVELCGGTHCARTEQVGGLRIVSERGVAAGVRRIEAVTGPGLHERLAHDEGLLGELEAALKAPRHELVSAVERMLAEAKSLRRDLEDAVRRAAQGAAPAGDRATVEGFVLEARRLPGLESKALRELAEGAREQAGADGLLLGSEKDGKAALVLALSASLAARLGGEAARDVVVLLAREIGGGGGGRATLAWAGARSATGLDDVLRGFAKALSHQLASGQGPA